MVIDRTPLCMLKTRSITAARYIAEVLLLHVRFFHASVGDNFLSMDDVQGPCHHANAIQGCLKDEDVHRTM